MFGKAFVSLCAVAAPAAYFMGVFGGGGIDRVVGASPAEVREGLKDLDIRNAPGAPASDPSRSGGVAPVFQLTQEGDDMVWTVMSGKDVAVRMIAHLEPVEGGAKTRVTAEVERGEAPDDYVAPAFRSTGITLGLFSMVLEDELDDLVRPAGLSDAECQELSEKLLSANAPPPDKQTGFAGVARTAMTLSAVEQELKRRGCNTGFKGNDFSTVKAEMVDDGGSYPSSASNACAPLVRLHGHAPATEEYDGKPG